MKNKSSKLVPKQLPASTKKNSVTPKMPSFLKKAAPKKR